ncbi:MAG: hypothetical protein U5K31_05155 [Balneolaceae bacterium]|nr:hypothetical protein [Balneolaceae bacterium]
MYLSHRLLAVVLAAVFLMAGCAGSGGETTVIHNVNRLHPGRRRGTADLHQHRFPRRQGTTDG